MECQVSLFYMYFISGGVASNDGRFPCPDLFGTFHSLENENIYVTHKKP